MTAALFEGGVFDRRAAVAALLASGPETLVVGGLGAPSWDIAAAGDAAWRFPLWGAMGGAAAVGLGLALAQPERPVLVVTGDGEMLMGLGSLATIAVAAPANLSVVVLDNARYGETGGQPSHTAGATDLAAIGRGAGLAEARRLLNPAEFEAACRAVHGLSGGPRLLVLAVRSREHPRVLPPRDGVALKLRFRAALGLDPD